MHPAERLLALFTYLLGRETPVDRERVRASVESYRGLSEAAFERTFERDKAALREAGMPLETVRLPDGPGYRLRRSELWLEEERFDARESLLLGLASSLWEEPEHRESAASALRRLGLDPEAPAREDVLPGLSADRRVAEAIAALTRGEDLVFDYRPATGLEGSPRRVRPWGLGHRFGHWYLTGWDVGRRAERTFRLSRADGLEAQRGTGRLAPEGFRMETALDRVTRAPLPEVGLTVSGSRRGVVLDWLEDGRAVLPARGTGKDAAEASGTLRLAVVDLAEFSRCLAELPAPWALVPLGPRQSAEDAAPVLLAPEACAELAAAAAERVRAARSLQEDLARAGAGTDSLPGTAPRGSRRREPVARRFLRLTDLLSLLSEGPATVADLAAATGVRPAAVRKDLELVDLAGASFYGTTDTGLRVRDDVVSLDRAALERPVRIAPDDAVRLLLGVLALESLTAEGAGDGTDADRGLGALALRLTRFLPEGLGGAGVVSVREEPGNRRLLERLRAAARRGSPVRIGYRSRGADAYLPREVLPTALRRDSGRWYLEALDAADGGLRTFRLDGIAGAEELPDRAQGPAPASSDEARRPRAAASPEDAPTTVLWIAAEAEGLAEDLGAEPVRDLAVDGRPGRLCRVRVHRRSSLARLALHEGGSLGFWSEPALLEEWLAGRTDLAGGPEG